MTGEIFPEGIKFTEDPSIPDGYVMIDGKLFSLASLQVRAYTPEELEEQGIKVNVTVDAMAEDMSRLEEIAGVIWDESRHIVPWEYIVENKHDGWFNTAYDTTIGAAHTIRSIIRKQDRA